MERDREGGRERERERERRRNVHIFVQCRIAVDDIGKCSPVGSVL